MTKTEFVREIAKKTGLTLKDSKAVVDAALETVTEELAKGGNVAFTGFGTFATKVNKARTGKNPFTGKKMDIPESKSPKFTAGATLKNAVK